MQLHVIRKDGTFSYSLPADSGKTIIGRRAGDTAPDLDLSPDVSVSRRHACIWEEQGNYWIEDLDSRLGTLVNGVAIKARHHQPLSPGDVVRVGKTNLLLERDSENGCPPSVPTNAPAEAMEIEGDIEKIKFSVDLGSDAAIPSSLELASRLLQTIQGLTASLGQGDPPAEVARALMLRLRELLPGADHVALLLSDDRASDLVLAAHEPEGDPRVSMTFARLAIDRKQAIVWIRERHGLPKNLSVSIEEQHLENILCAPLVWQDRALGALWLSGSGAKPFTRADMSLVIAVAHHAAMAVETQRMQEELARSGVTLKRIMAHFSPKVATRLIEQASHGRLRPGGLQSQVTLLCGDLRGFTKTTATMPADDIVDMLNEYFAELVAVIQRYGGTVDKFIGDAVLAVFGSPEADPEQHFNAVLAAREMQQAMLKANEKRTSRHLPTLEVGIGIHCGRVLHGFIGSEERVEYTVIGDAVNKTSRYCDGAAAGEIIISPELHQIVWRKVKAKPTEIQMKHEGKLRAFVLLLG